MITIKIDSEKIEKIFLLIFFSVILFIGLGVLFDYKIKHDFPYAYSASDAFQHQIRAEAIKDSGNFRYEAPYISKGFENVVGRYPPVIYHLSVIFSFSSGLQTYDSIYFLVLFFIALSILTMYIIIKDFNRNVALISLPLTLLAFTYPLSTGIRWGHWPSLLSQFFLIAFFWCILRINEEKFYLPTAIISSAVILTHTSEYVFALFFLALFFLIRFISNRFISNSNIGNNFIKNFLNNFKNNEIKKTILFFILTFLISLYYLIIFKNTWAKTQPYSFIVEPVWEGNPGFYILDFGLLLVFILFGIFFSFFRLKNMHPSLLVGFTMLFCGFLNYAGFGLRSFQIRFFWPIYLSVFFGFGIYSLIRFFIKKISIFYFIALSIIFSVLILGLIKIPLIPHYIPSTSEGIMNSNHWTALNWISKNTEVDSKIYFFYGDLYSQDALLRNSKRVHYQVDTEDFIKAIKDRKIKRNYLSELPGDNGGSISVRSGILSFVDASSTKSPDDFFGQQDICKFNYFIFDKVSSNQILAKFNLLIVNELINKGAQISFQNDFVLILKNNNVGGDCIEERSF